MQTSTWAIQGSFLICYFTVNNSSKTIIKAQPTEDIAHVSTVAIHIFLQNVLFVNVLFTNISPAFADQTYQ